jgi:N-acyl-phosphatidylethanolamine-hydrolysing phospholipase D
MKPTTSLLITVALFMISACRSNPYYDPSKPHHTAQGFRNNHPHAPPASFWKWRWQQWLNRLPKEPEGGYQFELVKADAAFLAANLSVPTLTWIGHSTLLLQAGGLNVLSDPHFTERASPFSFAGPKRRMPPALGFDELPHIDVVLISHNHYDHLDVTTVKRLNLQSGGPPLFLVPLGLKPWFASCGIENVVEMDWWDTHEHLGIAVHVVPVQHWSKRTLFDRNRTLWGGFVLVHPELKFFFAGDTGYSPDFKEIGRRLGPIDIAAIPIGAYEPRWFMQAQHVNPEEAVKIHSDLGARHSVAIHWGTFQLSNEMLDEPPRRLTHALDAAGIASERFFTMCHGETRRLDLLLQSRSTSRKAEQRTRTPSLNPALEPATLHHE